MKTNIIFCIVLTLFLSQSYGQLSLNFQRNIDLYKPYTQEAQEYMKLNDNVRIQTYQIQAFYAFLRRDKFNLLSGIGYKNIHHLVKDKIRVIPYYIISSGEVIDTIDYSAPTDLKSTSHSFSCIFDYQYLLINKNKYHSKIGGATEIFFFEIFNAEYIIKNKPPSPHYSEPIPMNSNAGGFMLSAVNLSFYYLNTWQLTEKFNIGARLSLGTNLYSDWDQFKRYAWLGVGLELGFGKLKEKVSKEN